MEMPDAEVQNLISEFKAWCDEKYGRQAEIARVLNVSRQLVNDWFAGKATPKIGTWLEIQAFLKKERRRTRKIAKQ